MIEEKTQKISPAEWEIMRIVWTLGKTTVQQVIDIMTKKSDWSPSTIKTLITRLAKKDFLAKDETTRPMILTAKVAERATMQEEVDAMFANFCAHCTGDILTQLVNNLTLSQADLRNLAEVAETKKVDAPTEVQCNCLGESHEMGCN